MKLLGNDVLTQEEFDTHMADQFNPMKLSVEKAEKDLKILKIVAYLSLALSIIGLCVQIIKF